MSLKIKTIFKTVMAVAVVSATVLTTSCNKDKDVDALELNQAQAATPYLITGQWGSPFAPAAWPKVYVNFATPSQSTSSSATHQVIFESHVNGNITAGTGYQLKYIAKDIDSVTAADWTSTGATAASTIGSGLWYTYDSSTNDYVATEDFTVIVATSGDVPVYAVKLVSFEDIQQQGAYPNLQVKADPNIEYKAL